MSHIIRHHWLCTLLAASCSACESPGGSTEVGGKSVSAEAGRAVEDGAVPMLDASPGVKLDAATLGMVDAAGGPPLPSNDAGPRDGGADGIGRFDAAVPFDAALQLDASRDASLGGAVSAGGTEIVRTLPDPDGGEVFLLSQTGLYVDFAAQRLSGDVLEFVPQYQLWSDGAAKRRFLRLPEGRTIDTSDMTSWSFPVGTMLFKEFSLDGVRLETRLIARTGDGERDYWMGAFVWDADQRDARFVAEGQDDVLGTPHDVPNTTQCGTCHNGERGRVLGVSAVQLALASPLGLAQLGEGGWLSEPAADAASFAAPGEPDVAAALGYLHANCGHCHNPRGSARPDTDLNLHLTAGERDPENTGAYVSTIGVPLQNFMDDTLTARVVPGNADESALWFRMNERGTRTQMPPLATEQADSDGVDLVRRWIESLDAP